MRKVEWAGWWVERMAARQGLRHDLLLVEHQHRHTHRAQPDEDRPRGLVVREAADGHEQVEEQGLDARLHNRIAELQA